MSEDKQPENSKIGIILTCGTIFLAHISLLNDYKGKRYLVTLAAVIICF